MAADLLFEGSSRRINVRQLLDRLQAVWQRMADAWEIRKQQLIDERTDKIRRVMEEYVCVRVLEREREKRER